MKKQRIFKFALLLVMLIGALLACNLPGDEPPTEAPQPDPATEAPPEASPTTPPDTKESRVEAEADRNRVFKILRDQEEEPIAQGDNAFLVVGEGINVDEVGRALLNFVGEKIIFQVEVLRDGELVVQELAEEEQSVAVRLLQNGGTFLNDFDADEEIKKRITIQTEFAEITATGTQFLVVKELNTPLEWVVGLDAADDDLIVTAQGVSKEVVAGQTRWIAPIGEPSAGIDAQMGNVEDWVERLSAGEQVNEIGQVVWDFADISTDMQPLAEISEPLVGFVEFPGGIQLELLDDDFYAREDCNGDGVIDLVIRGGAVDFDFTNVMARVQSFETIVNNPGNRESRGVLRLYNPADEEIDATEVRFGPGEVTTISLESDQAVHYARLELDEACLLGFEVPPPPDEDAPEGDSLRAAITGISLDGEVYIVDFTTEGFQPELPGTHVHFFFNTVPQEQAGTPGEGPWILYGGGSPFTEYSFGQKPHEATQMCILVANPDHSVQLGSGNCFALPPDPVPEVTEPPPVVTDVPVSLYAEITNITWYSYTYVVDFVTYGFVPTLPGTHVHFFFDTVPQEEAGVPGSGPWILYGGPSPFTGYEYDDKPESAHQMCILVANPDHSVQFYSGNCFDLPPTID